MVNGSGRIRNGGLRLREQKYKEEYARGLIVQMVAVDSGKEVCRFIRVVEKYQRKRRNDKS